MRLQVFDTLQFILEHPLNGRRPIAALYRYFRWQLISRMRDEIVVNWIDNAALSVKHGMTGATGNIYCGLHEFVEMAFLLHLLRPGDLFLDIGANIGSYTVLASKVCGARTIAFEPDQGTANALRRNIAINALEGLVTIEQVALGTEDGEICFTAGLDTMNRVATAADRHVQTVPVRRLDGIADLTNPTFAKLDVEGFEEEVLAGATNILSAPSLLALQLETCGPSIKRLISSFGFEQFYYDPMSRIISSEPLGYRTSNTLFIRNMDVVKGRVSQAVQREILGKFI